MRLYLQLIISGMLLFACNNGGGDKAVQDTTIQDKDNPEDSQRSAVHQQSSADFPQPVIETDSVDKDTSFLAKAIRSNKEEIAMGEAGEQKGSHDDVIRIGRLLQHDHKKLLNQLEALQKKRTGARSADTTSMAMRHDPVMDLPPGKIFDRQWVEMMIRKHEETLQSYETALTKEDQSIRDFITKAIPIVQEHKRQLEACKKKLP